jgi:UDP-N-acetyl-2-amino-2-deoxyglucuronate dehydrogenase
MRFALVGCGRIVKKHIDAIKEIRNAQLVGVCDIDLEKAKNASELAEGVPYFSSYDEMLKNVETDIVSILTPSGMHPEHTIDIVQKYKKHIVVEKPMALRMEDADAMIRTCDANSIRLFVVKQNRYNLPVQKLREAIETQALGKLVMGSVRVRWCRPQSYYDQAEWRGTWEYDGGVFTNQASHHVDLLEWMLGEPVSVMAKTATQLADIEVEDTGLAIIKFKKRCLGTGRGHNGNTAERP